MPPRGLVVCIHWFLQAVTVDRPGRIEVTAPAANVLTAVRNLDANVVHSIFRANLKHLAKKYILLTEQLLGRAGSWKERTSP